MKNIKKIIKIVLILGVLFVGFVGYRIYIILFTSNIKTEKVDVYIPTGSSFQDVVSILTPTIKDISSFVKVSKRTGYYSNVKPGHYILNKGMNNNQIVRTLRFGNTPVRISFNNQERIENLAGRIAQQIEADSVSLVKSFTDQSFLNDNGLNEDTVLSVFIPNTYEFYWNTSADKFRDRMLKECYRFWNEKDRKERAKKLGLTQLQVVSLAAIVQKETSKVDERPKVAGVYLNRLKNNMLLQADPTVIYSVKRHAGNFNMVIKRVFESHLKIDSPYNTYMYKGIPPGPIFMPDISSIDAVLYAENHDFLFFVADVNKWGYHKFSRSFEQHLNNKREYVDWLKKNNVK